MDGIYVSFLNYGIDDNQPTAKGDKKMFMRRVLYAIIFSLTKIENKDGL